MPSSGASGDSLHKDDKGASLKVEKADFAHEKSSPESRKNWENLNSGPKKP